MEVHKTEYLENKKSFLDEIKNICHSFKGLSLGEKKKLLKNSRYKL